MDLHSITEKRNAERNVEEILNTLPSEPSIKELAQKIMQGQKV